MSPIAVLQTHLRTLEAAIDVRDAGEILRRTAALFAPMSGLYSTPGPKTDTERRQADMGRGDAIMVSDRCAEKLREMPAAAGLLGVPFDPAPTLSALGYLCSLLRERAARPVDPPTPPTPA